MTTPDEIFDRESDPLWAQDWHGSVERTLDAAERTVELAREAGR